MEASWLIYGLCLAITVLVSAFFSGAETGMYCINRVKLHVQADRGSPRAVRLSRFLADGPSALSVTLIGTILANYVAAAIVAFFFEHEMALSDRGSEFYTTLLVAPILFVFGEMVPKNLAQRGADRLMYDAALALTLARRLFSPVVWVLRQIAVAVSGLLGPSATGGDEVLLARRRVAAMLREGLIHVGTDHLEHVDLVERVMELSSTSVASVMVPRGRTAVVSAGADRQEFLALVRKLPHSRLPVSDKAPRRIIGWVAVHELLADTSWNRVGDHVQPVITLRAGDSVAHAMVLLQAQRQSMAVVVDRHGLLLGIVTLEDLMGEITGELSED